MEDKTRWEEVDKTRIEGMVGDKTILAPRRLVGWVGVVKGRRRGEDFPLFEGRNTLGSSFPSQIILHDPNLSAEHLSIRFRDGAFSLFDLDSEAGVSLNGERAFHATLADGDGIIAGTSSFKVKFL